MVKTTETKTTITRRERMKEREKERTNERACRNDDDDELWCRASVSQSVSQSVELKN